MSTFKWYLLFVFVLMIHFLTQPFAVYSALERRLLSTRVEWSLKDILDQRFQDSLEDTLNDQMIARELWIKLNSTKDILMGRVLFNRVLRTQLGLHEVWLEDSLRLERNLSFIKEFESKYGAHISVVPHSGSLLTPSIHDSSLLFNADGFPQLRAWLLQHERPSTFFYQYDHHLNHLATPKMAQFVLNQLQHPMIMPSLNYCADFLGTLAPYVLSFNPKLDSLWMYDVAIESMSINGQHFTSLHDRSQCDGNNPYQALMHGNHGLTSIQTGHEGKGRLVLIKDSHAHQLIPFLGPHYSVIDVVDLRHFNASLQSLIGDDGDDVLLFVGEGSIRDDRNFFKLLR